MEPLIRSLEFERGVTHQAAKGYVDPSNLIEFSERRAQTLSGTYVTNPMFIYPGRDRDRDAREEISDCRNHLVFGMQENIEDEERNAKRLRALQLIAMAYRELEEEL